MLETSRNPVTHTQTTSSQLWIRSVHSRRGCMDPGTMLPIQYRTVSFNIEGLKEKGLEDAKRAKDFATIGIGHAELSNLEWHVIYPEKVFGQLFTSVIKGLSEEEVKFRFAEYGKNTPSPPPAHRLKQTSGYSFEGFRSILMLGSILVFICWKPLGDPTTQANLALAIVLLAVFFIRAAFNAWQDWSSSKVVASITSMMPEDFLLLRHGAKLTTATSRIVTRDILQIEAGNKLPADVRFVEISSDAKFDRSVLTEESLPLSGTVNASNDSYLEMQGTHCVSSSGLGIVVATSNKTVLGRIAKLTNKPETGMTTLKKETLHFVIIIVSIMLTMIVLVIVLYVAIAFTPGGPPIALTASLTITANVMRKNKVLCKSLKTVETLGAVSVVCSDKTGTLIKNELIAIKCSVNVKKMTSQSARDDIINISTNSVDQLMAIAGLCNSRELNAATGTLPLQQRNINGDATDQAILKFSEGLGSASELEVHLPLSEKCHYSSEELLLTIKGAPDVLID
ncbi:MAG: hypothetical protein Q9175_005121 [Cornicularia normoerica]